MTDRTGDTGRQTAAITIATVTITAADGTLRLRGLIQQRNLNDTRIFLSGILRCEM